MQKYEGVETTAVQNFPVNDPHRLPTPPVLELHTIFILVITHNPQAALFLFTHQEMLKDSKYI